MSFQLPESIVDRLLELLGHDDDFRALFTRDPRQALADLGFAPAADESIEIGCWWCFKTESLASKSAIRASHETLRNQLLLDRLIFNPIGLGMAGPDFKPSGVRQTIGDDVSETSNR